MRAEKLAWALAFIDQAKLDLELARFLYDVIKDIRMTTSLITRPELYCSAIYAYCQQSVEKALKALLWYEKGAIPRSHNPLDKVLNLRQMNERNMHGHLNIITRNKAPLNTILNMAPGANLKKAASMHELLSQPNTEYPFKASNGDIRMPYQEITTNDVTAALKIAGPLMCNIDKYLESRGLSPSNF